MKVRMDQWIDGLQWDWCISRQRFFGVKFPVWYSKRQGEEGKILVADVSQLPCDPAIDLPRDPSNKNGTGFYSRDEVVAETDIMDTWATSSISPQLSSKGISAETDLGNQSRHEKLFPADMRPQAHEIIRTWAFYTLTKAYLHSLDKDGKPRANPTEREKEIQTPWKNLMISGWCLAADKTKMSKSKGNVVTPTSLIEEKGSDIVRYWASTSHLGADTAYSEEVFKIGQKLVTKLFNAAKFASMHFDLLASRNLQSQSNVVVVSNKQEEAKSLHITEAADLWILSRLHNAAKQATESFEKFEYARAREAIEEFFWKDFCDNYLEICKVRSYGLEAEKLAGIDFTPTQKQEIKNKQLSAITTLYICLNTVLKLFAPFIPHITEEIFSGIFSDEFAKIGSIHARGNWPKLASIPFSESYHNIGQAALDVIFEVRKFKSDNSLSMKTTVKKIVVSSKQDLSEIAEDLRNVCNAEEVEISRGEFSIKIL
jgi:valyl-tRNA synthetase